MCRLVQQLHVCIVERLLCAMLILSCDMPQHAYPRVKSTKLLSLVLTLLNCG